MATITELLSQLQTDKNNLITNLISKGVEVSNTETFTTLVPKVLAISTGIDTSDATATASDIVAGKTAYVNGVKVTGNQVIVWSKGTVSTEVTSVNIPSGVTSIGTEAFYRCTSLESITIPDSVTSIGYGAFKVCSSLASITIPDSVTSIEEELFGNCSSLESITIPDSVTSIGKAAFGNCSSLASVTIGNGVTSIGNGAFVSCSSLASVTIGNGVTSIGNVAFGNCSSLANIYYKGTEEQWNAITKGTKWNMDMGSNVGGGTVITYNYTG